jgi:Gas vesicle protein K/Gas vesicle protein
MTESPTGFVSGRSEVSLVDVLDRLLAMGVVLAGDVDLAIADVTLARVRLLAAIGSEDTLRPGLPGQGGPTMPSPSEAPPGRAEPPRDERPAFDAGSTRPGSGGGSAASATPTLDEAQRALTEFADGLVREPEKVQQGLVQLVLSLVELLRQLMERQAVRRFEAGSLTDEQVEKVGTTLMLLQQRMDELREIFGLTEDDLSLDLGPLGRTV